MNLETLLTADGTLTLYVAELDETYHSRHGARQESLHVFIQNGLEAVLARGITEVRILEVGFGTGLNAWLTERHTQKEKTEVKYVALESHPLEEAIWLKLNYAHDALDKQMFDALHLAPWNRSVLIRPNFQLLKLHTTIQQADLRPSTFNLIYFDAFAPEKQPEMWTMPVLEKVVLSMKPEAVWVTYCAKGQVKRDLKSLGLRVQTLPGPPGKREMIRAHKP